DARADRVTLFTQQVALYAQQTSAYSQYLSAIGKCGPVGSMAVAPTTPGAAPVPALPSPASPGTTPTPAPGSSTTSSGPCNGAPSATSKYELAVPKTLAPLTDRFL